MYGLELKATLSQVTPQRGVLNMYKSQANLRPRQCFFSDSVWPLFVAFVGCSDEKLDVFGQYCEKTPRKWSPLLIHVRFGSQGLVKLDLLRLFGADPRK